MSTATPTSRPSSRRVPWREAAVVALTSAALTAVAWRAVPVWDDGWLWLIVHDGDRRIAGSLGDRPLLGATWQALADRGVIWEAAALIHFLAWAGTGLVTLRLWASLFPDRDGHALAAACLALGPVLCRVQFVLVNPVSGVVSSLLAYVAILVLARRPRRDGPGFVRFASHVGAWTLVAVGVLLTEYALAAAMAGAMLLAIAGRRDGEPASRRWSAVAGLAASGAVSYLVFLWTSDAAVRPGIRPEALRPEAGHLWRAAIHVGSIVWRGALGTILERTGQIDVSDRASAASLAIGLTVAGLVVLAARGQPGRPGTGGEGRLPAALGTVGLVAALALGMTPFVLLGPRPEETITSRYWLPVLPIASCLTVSLLLRLLRPRLAWVVPPLCGLVAGYFLADQAQRVLREHARVTSWGAQVETHVPDEGLTVAIFDAEWEGGPAGARDYELTVRLAAGWPAAKRRRFWAFPDWESARERLREAAPASAAPESRSPASPLELDVSVQGVVRRGPVGRILWVRVPASGPPTIESSDAHAPRHAGE